MNVPSHPSHDGASVLSRRTVLAAFCTTSASTLLWGARITYAQVATPVWERPGDLPWPVQEVYGTTWNGRGVIVGGMIVGEDGRSSAVDRVGFYDPATGIWREGTPLPSPRHHPVVAAADGRLYAIGGARHGLDGEPDGEHWRQQTDVLAMQDTEWVRGPALPFAQSEGVALVHGPRIHLVTGRAPLSPGSTTWAEQRDTAFHQVLDVAEGRWSFPAPASAPRNRATGGVIDGKLYVAGGRTMEGGNMARLDMYNPEGDRWHELAPMPVAAGCLASAAAGGHLYVFGGEELEGSGTQAVIGKSWRYDPAADRWTALTDMPTPRHGLAAIALDERILLVVGGSLPATGRTTGIVEALVLAR